MTLAPEQSRTDPVPFVGCPAHRAPRPARSPRGSRRLPGPASPGPGADAAAPDGPDRPRLAEGVQLLGEYAGTGYVTPQHLARRPGGQLVQLSVLLHTVAEHCDGQRDYGQIAERVSEDYGKTVSADNVQTLVDKLRPLGVLADRDGSSPQVEESDPLLGLKFRTQLLTPRLVRPLARLAHPLFWPPVVAVVLSALIAVDVWLFFVHGLGQGLRATVQQPAVFLLVFAVVVAATALHEFGHAAACSYGGARPGGMGAGVYIVWPAFYTDVTEAYQLSRGGRLRTDLGGVYFNGLAVLAVAGAYAVTRYDPLILICFVLQVLVLQQMIPLLRLDGYYVLSDLVGVPDLFRRIGPVLRSAIPFRAREPEVDQLKPWVRRVVTGWVLVLIPALLLNLVYLMLSAPRMVATGWDSGMRLLGSFGGTDGAAAKAWIGVQLLLLVLPFGGLTYTLGRVGNRVSRGAWSWSAGSVPRRLGVLTGAGLLVGLLVLAWWPDGRLTPYREGERGTLGESARSLTRSPQGSPLLRGPSQAQKDLPAVQPGDSAVPRSPAPQPSPAGASPSPGTAGTLPPAPATDRAPDAAPDGTAPDGTGPDGTAPDGTAPDGTTRTSPAPPQPSPASPQPGPASPQPGPAEPTSPSDGTATTAPSPATAGATAEASPEAAPEASPAPASGGTTTGPAAGPTAQPSPTVG